MQPTVPLLDNTFPNSYTITVAPTPFQAAGEKSPHRYVFENVLVESNYQTDSQSWQVVDNPYFTLVVDGHLYLASSKRLDPRQNASEFLERITVTSIDRAIEEIAGGTFNLFIIDKEKKRMVVIGDRWGSIPLYMIKQDDKFHLSGNQFSFRKIASLFDAAVVEFLRYGYLPYSASLYLNVDRLLPGQRIDLDLANNQLRISPPAVYEFKPVKHRIALMADAGELFHRALAAYFARFDSQSISMELDGGFNSRLLYAWSHALSPDVFFLDSPGKKQEKKIVRKIARLHESDLQITTFNPELLFQYLAQATRTFRLIHSLEFTESIHRYHVFCDRAPAHPLLSYPGEFLTGGLLNSGQNPQPHPTASAQPDNSSIRDIPFYQSMLYNLPQALDDASLEGILLPDIEVWMLNACRGILEVNRNAGHVHEDFVEILTNYTQGRGLAAAIPVAVHNCSVGFSPFSDYHLSEVCFDMDKQLRNHRRFMFYYWKTFFPEMAAIPSISNPLQTHSPGEKVRNIARNLFHRFQGKNEAGQHYQQILNQLTGLNGGVEATITALIKDYSDNVPGFIANSLKSLTKKPGTDPRLFIRFISLMAYLSGSG